MASNIHPSAPTIFKNFGPRKIAACLKPFSPQFIPVSEDGFKALNYSQKLVFQLTVLPNLHHCTTIDANRTASFRQLYTKVTILSYHSIEILDTHRESLSKLKY
jgi:hypothetical protein